MPENIGLGLEPPKDKCDDIKCPWHGHLKVRGRVFRGAVRSAKAPNTAIIEWDYYHRIPKYERFERRKTRVVAYRPDCIPAKNGDIVAVAECRPLSKTKKFVVVRNSGGSE
jgi:small subunit ribosomal protein S17